jgi:AraC family transcriptional regulator
MSSTTDTFARFVDVVAESLDTPRTSGDAVARRAHLSRFHFDRVVAAIAGEPPGAFRRRIKLERAAYQLLTDGCGVLEIAVDAGYSSHEAFTRAFGKAYGMSPSRWRRSPGPSFWLAAPSGVHFSPPGSLRVPATRKVTAMELLQRIVSHHVWLVGEIVDRLDRLDDEALDRPIEISVEYIDSAPSLRSATSRLIGQLAMWNAAVAGRAYDFEAERDETVASMRARLATAGTEFLDLTRQLEDEGRLDETFVDAICDPPEVFTYGGMLAHVLAFGATRRTLVIGALASAGVGDLGAGDPMRWVAEQI